MTDQNSLFQLTNMNLSLLEDDVSGFIYTTQIYYRISEDYTYIGKMLLSLWEKHKELFVSDDFRTLFENSLSEIETLKPVKHFAVDDGTMFFDPSIVPLHDDEIFLDCGALEMSTSLEFAYRVKNRFQKIYAFEPDPACFEMCQDNLKMFDRSVRDRVFLYNVGLDEINGKRSFEMAKVPGNSKIAKDGQETISVNRLDDLPDCQDITFMKIHTEGTELSVIKGAAELIKRNHPAIAVSLYHNLKELVNVPLLLHGLVPSYKLYMRHYSLGTTESVLYAVCREQTA